MLYTFGNASGISREEGLVAIKPSGVPYETMKPEDLVVVDLEGKIVEGSFRPSSDLATHLILYRAFRDIGGIAHTHSSAATAWAQAQKEIPCFGTTHADYFRGPVPVTKPLTPAEIRTNYEANTGHAIVRRFKKLDPLHVPAVLVAGARAILLGKIAIGSGAHCRDTGRNCRDGLSDDHGEFQSAGRFQNIFTKSTSCGNMEAPHITARKNRVGSLADVAVRLVTTCDVSI